MQVEQDIPVYFYLWAKTDKERSSGRLHPLLHHMLDVGECSLALWRYSLCEQTRKTFASWLGLDQDAAGNLLAFWAALHDIGKAAPGFQAKYLPCLPTLKSRGFVFPPAAVNPAPHGILTTWALKELLPSETGISSRDARHIAFALGGHHGAWPTNDLVQSPALKSSDKGSGLWDVARRDLLAVLKAIYQPVDSVFLPEEDERQMELNTFLTLFSGLVSVADWIGSMVECFPLDDQYQLPFHYVQKARTQARLALEKLGWINWQADGSLLSFAAMFPEMPVPRQVQAEVMALAENLELPALLILEAPTGIGKTEAALFLADTWVQRFRGKGMYFAMPTQATSNQMFGRVVNFLEKRYPGQPLNTHLVHGAALLEETQENPELSGIDDYESGPGFQSVIEGTVRAEGWFLPRKRTLLAPFGVGTVDQALLSVLQTKHFFVRMFGLAHKVVVFDEIHAYDTYMSTLFQRLLGWLRSIGTSVILLSATLPEKTRRELVGAWLGREDVQIYPADYPRLTTAGAGQVQTFSLTAPQSHRLHLDWVEASPEQIAAHLQDKLVQGGCVAVICNRVRRAQDVYSAIKASNIVDEDCLILFHARYPFQWREEIEKRVLEIFSKNAVAPGQPNPKRPRRAIVVATQVIEQSLDLDFDYMVTDLAPVDLLIQRAGRLHRHSQNQSARPALLASPVLAVCKPEEQGGLPNFGLDKNIYDLSILLRTWHVLRQNAHLSLPEQVSGLIEDVYGAELAPAVYSDGFIQAVRDAERQSRRQMVDSMVEASKRLVHVPDDENLITQSNKKLEEEDEKVGAAFKALTRLAEPGVSIICLHQTPAGVMLEPDGEEENVDLEKRPNLHRAKKLLRRAVSIQRKDVVHHFFKNEKAPTEWHRMAILRQHIPVIFDGNGKYQPEGADFILKLTRELGLEVVKIKKEEA